MVERVRNIKPIEASKDNIKELTKRMIRDSKQIFWARPAEKYRAEIIGLNDKFQIHDFINLTAYQESTKKTIKLRTCLYLPDESDFQYPTALVFMFHGMGSHSEPSAFMAKDFASLGCAVAAYDYRGHGYSEGLPGNIENMEYVFEDSRQFISKTIAFLKEKYYKEEDSNSIIFLNNKFLMGLSMGGFLSYFLSKDTKDEYKGIVFFAPALQVSSNIIIQGFTKVIGSLVPNGYLPKLNRESWVVKNPKFHENLDEVHTRTYIKFRTMAELVRFAPIIQKECTNYDVPFVIISAGKDKLVKPLGHLEFYVKAKSKDKELWYYDNCWHAVYFEEEMYDILNRLKKWLKNRIDPMTEKCTIIGKMSV